MNDIDLCNDKKFMADYDYQLHILKKKSCLNCNISYNICPCVKCLKIGCLFSLFKRKTSRKWENVAAK